jgi:23S rRNA-/tRNA-specific pseudouridylate synthase
MSSIGHPIVGDKAYGSTIETERIKLHATSLMCMINNKEMTFLSSSPFHE